MLRSASHYGHLTVCAFGLQGRQEAGNLSEEVLQYWCEAMKAERKAVCPWRERRGWR